jgi:hypothetical protein
VTICVITSKKRKRCSLADLVLGAVQLSCPKKVADSSITWPLSASFFPLILAVIYPAHGPAIREPYKKLNEYIAHRELREQQILDAMKAGLTEISAMVKAHLC